MHLSVEGAAKYIDFLKSAFGAVELSRSPGPDGKLMHALLQIGDSMIMLNDDMGGSNGCPPTVRGNLPVVLNLYVPNADATFNQAIAAGCTVAMPIADMFWGDRYGHLLDPAGFKWAVATHKEDLTPAQIQERAAAFFSGAAKAGGSNA